MKIWQRYLIKQFLLVFLALIIAFYGLYTCIDYSINAKDFAKGSYSAWDLIYYYSQQFSKRAAIFIPLALLLANIRVLSKLNTEHELLALSMGGLSPIRLISPFIMIAFLAYFSLLANFEYFIPSSLQKLQEFEDKNFNDKKRTSNSVKSLRLKDNSTLFYLAYNSASQEFLDLYWLKNTQEIFHIEALSLFTQPPQARNVARIKKNPQGNYFLDEMSSLSFFPEIKVDQTTLANAIIPYEQLAISKLWKKTTLEKNLRLAEKAELLSHFHFRLALPLACFFCILIPAPYCMTYSRQVPTFLIYCLSLFGLISFFTFMNTALIFAQNNLVHPALIIWFTPLFLISIPCLIFLFSISKSSKTL